MSAYFKTIIFDLDGTLVDTAPDVLSSVNYALKKMGVPSIPMEAMKEAIGPAKEEFIRAVLPGVGESEYESFLTLFREFYWNHCLDQTVLFQGMDKVLKQLENRILAVASNKPKRFTERILEGLNIRGFFHSVIGPEDVAQAKPHPEMIFTILNMVNQIPSETLFVGDTDGDILAAQSAGVKSCLAGYGYGNSKRLQGSRPDFFINYPEELLMYLDHQY
jgi:phosphoglycolate phosphatase